MLRQFLLRLLPRKGKGLIRAAEHEHLDQVQTYLEADADVLRSTRREERAPT